MNLPESEEWKRVFCIETSTSKDEGVKRGWFALEIVIEKDCNVLCKGGGHKWVVPYCLLL
jgi:hypothetical protein